MDPNENNNEMTKDKSAQQDKPDSIGSGAKNQTGQGQANDENERSLTGDDLDEREREASSPF